MPRTEQLGQTREDISVQGTKMLTQLRPLHDAAIGLVSEKTLL